MALVRLNKRLIDSLPPAKHPRGERYYDTMLKNFGLTVYQSGQKSFFVDYSIMNNGKSVRKQFTIGKYGPLTLDAARDKARKYLAQVIDGVDPAHEERAIEDVGLLEDWIEHYLNSIASGKKSLREDIRYLGQAKVLWGKVPLNKMTTEMIETEYHRIRKTKNKHGKEKTATANRWLASLRACLQAAWRREKMLSNPVMRIKKVSDDNPRKRILSKEEEIRFFAAIEQIPDIFAQAAFKLQFHAGLRLSEVLRAKWTDVDFESMTWMIPTNKTGKKQHVALSSVLIEIFNDLPRLGTCIIVGRNPDKPRADLKRSWNLIRANGKLNDVNIHDLRRTLGSDVAKTHGIHVASKVLRHSDIRVTEKHYAHLQMDDLRSVMEERGKRYKDADKKENATIPAKSG